MNVPRRSSRPTYDAPDAVMRLAGQWLARRDRGFTAAEQAAFDEWVCASESHAAAVAQLEQTMTTFDALRVLAPDAEFSAHRTPNADAFAPPRRAARWAFPALATAGIAAALALVFWRATPPPAPTSWHYASASAAYERATLIDGSLIELNGDTVVDVEFTPTQRNVRLSRGEAHFKVAKNPARPFVVNANGVAFRAVGTAFNVRMGHSDVEMLVTEGKVQVEPARASGGATGTTQAELPLLTAGHKIVVPTASSAPPLIAVVTAAEIDRTLEWQRRVFEFTKMSLGEVVTEFNRHNRVKLVIAEPELETLRFGGSFHMDKIDAFVRLLESSFGITATRSGDTITLHKAS